MHNMRIDNNARSMRIDSNARSMGAILADIVQELQEFVNTRIQMVKSELHETMSAVSVALPLGVLTLILGTTGFLLLTAAVVVIVASAFAGSAYAWFYSFIIVGVIWIAFAGAAAFFAYTEFRAKGKFPKHTVDVLKADKVWIESEARTKYERVA
jgi:uncharacterized membrane protein YqjE